MNIKREYFLLASLVILAFTTIVTLYKTGHLNSLKRIYHKLALASGLNKPTSNIKTDELLPFDYVGDFMDLNGNPVTLDSFKGKAIFINIWASWCGPCRLEMPYIVSMYHKLKDTENLEILLINIDTEKEKAVKYIESKEYFDLPIIYANEKLTGSLKTKSIPTSLVISPNGEVVFYQLGTTNFDSESFREFLISTSKL